ncbi:MAG: GyrI-like domain-containing protein [Terracidiphilus sp.]|jgi:DNA gyrase inhibitor GyrI
MNLTLEPEIVQWPPTHYVFIERIGPFMQTAFPAWQQLHQLERLISEHNQITGAMALYKMKPDTYRAGFILAAPPVSLPGELSYERFPGGKYSKFVLTGSYSNLPQASGRVWEIVSKTNLMVRPDFAIEHYANDPKTTPEDNLITEILVPTA